MFGLLFNHNTQNFIVIVFFFRLCVMSFAINTKCTNFCFNYVTSNESTITGISLSMTN